MALAGCKVPEGNHQLSQERLKELAIEPADKRLARKQIQPEQALYAEKPISRRKIQSGRISLAYASTHPWPMFGRS